MWAIVGIRQASDGLPGSWQPDVPDGVAFSSISGDTTRNVARLRAGTDAGRAADPSRLMIVRTDANFVSPTRIRLGRTLDSLVSADGRFMAESFTGQPLHFRASVRDAVLAIVDNWDDNDPDRPNALRPSADGRIRVRVGPDVVIDRPATVDEILRRSQVPLRTVSDLI